MTELREGERSERARERKSANERERKKICNNVLKNSFDKAIEFLIGHTVHAYDLMQYVKR